MVRKPHRISATRLYPLTSSSSRRLPFTRSICPEAQFVMRLRSQDFGFRLGTGVFALALAITVNAIGVELTRQSLLSIQKFGLNFWRTTTWDPVVGGFGAFPFIWGTLYSSILALCIAAPVSIGIAVFV